MDAHSRWMRWSSDSDSEDESWLLIMNDGVLLGQIDEVAGGSRLLMEDRWRMHSRHSKEKNWLDGIFPVSFAWASSAAVS